MKKICYCTTVPITLNSFVLKSVEYIHENTDWDISFISSYDKEFEQSLPEYVHYFPIEMKRGVSLDGLRVIDQMRRIFEREKFDLIQYSTPNASLYASVAAKLAKIPVRLYCQWGMAFVGFSGIKRMIFKSIEKLICRLSTWVEPDSKSNLDFAHKEGLYPIDKGSVVWNGSACGIDIQKFDISRKDEFRKEIRGSYNIPEDAIVFSFVGRVKRDKGINELLRSYKSLTSKRPAYLFVVGGNEVDDAVDMELYNWSITQKDILYIGNTTEVEKYLAASDCFILPSYREGFGMSVVEAQAMGVPVVISDIPGPIDAVLPDKTGIVVNKQSVSQLLSAMEKMYDDPKLRNSYGKAGYEYVVEKFEQKKFFEYLLLDRTQLMK